MRKKDYVMIAETLKAHYNEKGYTSIDVLIDSLSSAFKKANPKFFDLDDFWKASH